MPRMRLLIMGISLALGAFAERAQAVPGCPFCAPSPPPFSERLAGCDAALEVKWVSMASDETLGKESTTFEVVVPYRTTTRQFKAGDKVVWNIGLNAEPGDPYLLIGAEVGDKVEWEEPVRLGGEYLYAYIRKVPPPEAPDRLAFYLKFLEFPEAEIRNDAYGEFSRAQFADVSALAPKLPRAKLRQWLASEDPQMQVRLGLYGMMLGLAGDDSDAEFLEQRILTIPEKDKPRLGVDGMMAGYLMLRGEKGLHTLTKAKFDDPRAQDDLLGVRNALLFLWDYAPDRIPPEALRAAMRRFLDHSALAVNVIEDLARWKDWQSLDRLVAGYGKQPFDSPLTKQKIVTFALVCEKDGLKTSPQKLPASALKARKFLNGLDPAFVKSVERNPLLGGRK